MGNKCIKFFKHSASVAPCQGSQGNDNLGIELQSIPMHDNDFYNKKEIKILLLGTSDSGKTTFSRQVRVLHGQPFSETEMKNFKKIVRSLCLEELSNILVEYIASQKVTTELAEKSIDFINRIRRGLVARDTIDSALSIWKDMEIDFEKFESLMKIKFIRTRTEDHQCLENSIYSEARETVSSNLLYQSDDPGYHLLPKFDEIMSPGYEPTLDDLLSIRIRTSGIVETKLIKNELSITIIDVGGQRSERKKWLHVMDNVDAVLFIASMSEYDQKLNEDSMKNRMQESITLFDNICASPWFKKMPMILFLNKKDLFDDKIKRSLLVNYFSNFQGGTDKRLAQKFISDLFEKNGSFQRDIYRHFTCAKDTKNIDTVFDAVTDLIYQNTLEEYRMI